MNIRRVWPVLVVSLLGLGMLAVACGPTGGSGGSEVPVPQDAQETVALVQQDLVEQLGISPSEVQLTSIEAVEWPDTSLGCPGDELMYAQVTSPGFKITLEAEGTEHTYHTGPDHFVRCLSDSADEAPAHLIRNDPAAATLGVQAQEDLSQLLGISLDEVTVVSVEAVQWPDSSLGCPEEGMMYLQMVTPGYRIVVAGEGQEYVYHTDHNRAVRCDQ